MLKGLQIGQAVETTGVGAVIPVVVDTTTGSGLMHAQSTVQSYCLSHNLLLRALVIVPSVMSKDQRDLHTPLTSSSDAQETTSLPKTLPFVDDLDILADRLANNLDSNLRTTLKLLAALVPVLRSDGGRVVSLLPSRVRLKHSPEPCEQVDLSFAVSSAATTEVWRYVQKQLETNGIFTSLVHMASSCEAIDQVKSAHHPSFSFIKSLVQDILLIVYGQYPLIKPQHDPAQTLRPGTSRAPLKRTSNANCPPLLLDAVRSALIRSWPRRDYAVGLGPRLEQAWRMLPGHSIIEKLL
jgi:hypothetical protein